MQYPLYSHRFGTPKRILTWTPEVYFILVLIWWSVATYLGQKNIDNTLLLNYPALILIATLIVQFFIKNKHLGVTVAAVLALGTFFLIIAMFIYILDWDFTQRTARFLMYDGLFIALNLFMAFRMFRKYSKMYDPYDNDVPLGI